MPVLFLFTFRFLRLLLSGHQAIAIENATLRMQIAAFQRKRKRPLLTTLDRLFWISLRSVWSDWRRPLLYVQPDTVVRWQRERFRKFWARLSKPQGRRRGRPATAAGVRRLIEQMVAANPLWRAPRIHGELKMLGVAISERTVSRILRRVRRPPNQTWKTFLHNHVGQMVSIDFFTVPTITMRVLFVLIVLEHDRRKVLHFNVTEHPTGAWTAQQIVEACADREAAQYLIRDRDSRYSAEVQLRIKSMGIQEILTAAKSPWQNPYAERLIGSIRRECLNHYIILNARHLKRTLASYFRYYHQTRTHLSLGKQCPFPRAALNVGKIVAIPQLGGLHHRYERIAA
ncbi:MAG TPA: integrase core domain-containing protein [Bryobacteraceae bacterium]|nr:integrase core domain-containing protein [Bryobacteraceae bacterium]